MADENGNQGTGKKKSKVKLIIIILIVLILIGGGVAAYFFVFSGGQADTTQQNNQQSVQESRSEKSATIGPLYSFDTFIVNLSDAGGSRYLKVTMQVELSSSELEAEIEKRKPQLRDIILTVLSSKTYAEVSTAQGKLALKQEIIRRVNLVLTTGTLENVYFTEFVAQ